MQRGMMSTQHDSSQVFSGHMWVMWSNSVMAQRACELLSGETLVPGLPTVCEIASQAFVFTASENVVDAPKYGHHAWDDVTV